MLRLTLPARRRRPSSWLVWKGGTQTLPRYTTHATGFPLPAPLPSPPCSNKFIHTNLSQLLTISRNAISHDLTVSHNLSQPHNLSRSHDLRLIYMLTQSRFARLVSLGSLVS